MNTLYAVVFYESKSMQAIIPDQVFYCKERAERAAAERYFLTGMEENSAMYVVVELTVQDEPQSI